MEYYKESLIEFKNWVEHGYAHNTYMPSSFAINTAVDALEKQIPKKPKVEIYIYPRGYTDARDNSDDLLCPCCGESLMEDDHHCKCGQAIDWEV